MEKQSDVTSVQPLSHSLVDLSIIGLDVEDGDAGVTVGGGEDDLRRQKKVCKGDLCCSERFCRWCTSGGVDDVTAGAGHNTQSFL